MIPMDREVDELAEVYSPQQLQQKYKVTQELMYLLALQKVQSDMKAAQNQLAMSQQQQPGTIKDQMEGQVFQEKLRQVSGTIAQQEAQRRQRQQRMMASGGIVGFTSGGGVTDEDIADYKRSNPRSRRLSDEQIRQTILKRREARTFMEPLIRGEGIVAARAAAEALASPEQDTAAVEPKPAPRTIPDMGGLGVLAPKKQTEKATTDTTDKTVVSGAADRAGGVADVGGGGIADVTSTTTPFTKPDPVIDQLPAGLKDSLTSMANMGSEGIAAAAGEAERRAERIAGRTDKAQKFERMREEQERLYNELQDPDKQQAQMRRNIFAAFGRGGNSFGQLMGNALTAISRTEAGQDQLKQLALSKKQGVDTLAMELDVKVADQTNQSINAAIDAAKADRRQAMDTISNLTAETARQNRQFVRDQFDFQSEGALQAFRRAELVSRQLDRQVSRDVTDLNTLTSAINDIRATRADVLKEVLSTNQRYLQLKALERQGKLDEEEAEELNELKKSVETVIYERLGASDEILQRLTEQADAVRSKREISVDQIENFAALPQ
tara:strand:- start:6482 stop:8140 length:1659 start_codon:yes stop_codon:yes gene_type:complete